MKFPIHKLLFLQSKPKITKSSEITKPPEEMLKPPEITKLNMVSVGKLLTNQTPRGAKEIDYQKEAKLLVERYKNSQ